MAAGQSHAASPGELAVELVREKLYRRLNKEIPYRLNVAVEAVGPWRPRPPLPAAATAETAATATAKAAREPTEPRQDPVEGEGLYIRVGVGVASKLVKSIVVGKGGEVIQEYVAEPTQAELTRILKQPVKLVVGVRIVG
jgi:GTPase Era involved in 16S rRNA processing